MPQSTLAIGLMSGTSRDGIDAALIETDGEGAVAALEFHAMAYDEGFRLRLAEACQRAMAMERPGFEPLIAAVEVELTEYHVQAVADLLGRSGHIAEDVGVIGFHGHTVIHKPDRGITRQFGDGALLARETGIPVVSDFRAADVAGGGQGAPLAPLYHAALTRNLDKPLAVLNLGGVANVTWISPDGGLVAFDTGPGNALIDDWVRENRERDMDSPMDKDGRLAHAGAVIEDALAELLDDPYFARAYPKSLDRSAFDPAPVKGLSLADGAATLTAFTARTVEKAVHILPAPPNRWLVCGGGRRNPALMAALRGQLAAPVESVEMTGWSGDALEAQAFGFLAVRSLKGLPLSLPSTTGVDKPTTGGVLHKPG